MSLGQWFGGARSGGGGGYDPWFGTPFSSDIWDPSSSGINLLRAQDSDRRDDPDALAHAHVDWRETDNAHIFHADLPGLKKEEVKVHVVDGNILEISGERRKEQKANNDKWHRVERRRGSFVRRFRLPENANLEEIKCSLDNGVLNVTVPKKSVEETPRNVKYIDVE